MSVLSWWAMRSLPSVNLLQRFAQGDELSRDCKRVVFDLIVRMQLVVTKNLRIILSDVRQITFIGSAGSPR